MYFMSEVGDVDVVLGFGCYMMDLCIYVIVILIISSQILEFICLTGNLIGIFENGCSNLASIGASNAFR